MVYPLLAISHFHGGTGDGKLGGRPQCLTRQRSLSLPAVLTFLLSGVQGAVQSEVNLFFANLRDQADSIRRVAAQAFCKARYKISALVFSDIDRQLIAAVEAHLGVPRWQGLRVVAGDGTAVRLTMMKDRVRSIVTGVAFGLYLPGMELFLDFALRRCSSGTPSRQW